MKPPIIEIAHLHHWYHEFDHPVILILYDAQKHRAFWLDVQAEVEKRGTFDEDPHTDVISLRIPVTNRVNLYAVDRFRQMSLSRMNKLTE